MKLLKELMEEAKPKFIDVIHKGKNIGSVWKVGEENWHAEHNDSGMSWGLIDTKEFDLI